MTTPDYRLRQQLGFKLSRTSRLMQQRLETDLQSQGLTRLTWCVLSSVGLEGLNTPSAIADNLGVKRPTISRLLKQLAEEGMLQRSLRDEDGRGRKIALTADGVEAVQKSLPIVMANTAHFSEMLDRENLENLHVSLDRILSDADGELDHL